MRGAQRRAHIPLFRHSLTLGPRNELLLSVVMGCGASTAAGGEAPEKPAPRTATGGAANGQPRLGVEQRRGSVRREAFSAEQFIMDEAKPPTTTTRRSSIKKTFRASSTQLESGAIVTQYEKDESSLEIIKKATADNPLFEALSDEQKSICFGAMVDEECSAGDVVITQGERGDLFYVVEKGKFEAYIKERGDEVVKHYESGSGFGELALLYGKPRQATVKCTEGGRLWAIDRGVFNMIMVASNKCGAARERE